MDAKALAKSKRAHSQHHKDKSYLHHKSKAPSISSDNAGTKAKPPGKQVGEKTRQAVRISRLPSNWDRYEDELDFEIDDLSRDSTSQSSDVVVPKSKGADYSYLIAEAQSQAQSQSYSYSDCFASLDDVIPGELPSNMCVKNLGEDDRGFIEGVGSMLSVRGEGILSWSGDDNFIVEDKTTAVQEASFLSLNLNALAEQLAKVDLSERLFVEADLLLSELGADGSIASSTEESNKRQTTLDSKAAVNSSKDLAFTDFSEKVADESLASIGDEPGQIQSTHESEAAIDISEDVAFDDSSEKIKVVDTEFTLIGSRTYNKDATFSSQGPGLVNQVKDDLSSRQFGKSGRSRAMEPTTWFKENTVSVSKRKLPNFEASAAEAELDMLLNSFSDNKFLDSSGYKPSNTFIKSPQASSTALPQLSGKGPDLSKTASVTASFDDVLDDLLEETSNLMNRNSLSQSRDVKVVPHDTQSSSHSVTKSKVLDDFDSWLDTI